MNFSYYLFKGPYSLVWMLLKKLHLLSPVVFYCGEPLDHYIFAPVQKHLPTIKYVTDKAQVRTFLTNQNIPYAILPAFPTAVIMARHATYKFPCKAIIKVGMRHGPYHFKRMTSAQNYNAFDVYMMTSFADVEAGKKAGITSARAIGYPKLDPAFDGTINTETKQSLRIKLGFSTDKPVLLFTATFDSSGLSAIELWYDKLESLTSKYNVIVTLHPWIAPKYRDRIRLSKHVHLISDLDVVPYISLADVVIGDNSSILAECCALDKPIITFTTRSARRSLEEIDQLLDSISYRIPSFHMLMPMIEHALANPAELLSARQAANQLMFDTLDGKAGQRAAELIREYIPALNN